MQRLVAFALMALSVGACSQRAPSTPAVATSSVVATTSPAPSPVAPSSGLPYRGPGLIDHVTWTSDGKGRVLRVYPSGAGRSSADPGARASAWLEVLRAAPGADSPSMREQFFCHWDFARVVEPDKPSWNLEAWRPEVSYAVMTQAACNPGGPE